MPSPIKAAIIHSLLACAANAKLFKAALATRVPN
jgi:hypothetical protein